LNSRIEFSTALSASKFEIKEAGAAFSQRSTPTNVTSTPLPPRQKHGDIEVTQLYKNSVRRDAS